MEQLLNEILVAVIKVLVPYIGVLIGYGITQLIKQIKEKKVRRFAYDAVLWAEDKITENGEIKFEMAKNLLVDKMKVDEEEADALIRSAYQQIFNQIPERQ